MANFLKTVFKYLYRLLAMIILGILLMTLAYMLPIDPIQNNMERAAKTIEKEGDFPQKYSWCLSRVDSFTDSIMLLEASTPNEGNAMKSAMLSGRFVHGEDIPSDVVIKIYGDEHAEPTGISNYFRYWHGYLTVLKPLLEITDYAHIRIINFIVQSSLTVIIVALLWKKQKHFILPFILALLCIAPQMSAICMQYSTCYYVMLFGSIAILLQHEDTPGLRQYFLFMYIGCATSFFDFLTYPIATLGIPLVFLLNSLDKLDNLLNNCFIIIKASVSWAVGYVFMWAGKFIAGGFITGADILGDALNERLYWMAEDTYVEYELAVNPFKVFYRELRSFSLNPAILLAITFAIVTFIILIKRLKSEGKGILNIFSQFVPYLIVAALPFAWYAVMMSHSWEHDFFTYKALVVTAFAGLSMLSRLAFHTTKNGEKSIA